MRQVDNLTTFMCRMPWKSGSLKLLEHSGSHRACYGTLVTFLTQSRESACNYCKIYLLVIQSSCKNEAMSHGAVDVTSFVRENSLTKLYVVFQFQFDFLNKFTVLPLHYPVFTSALPNHVINKF